MNSCPLFLGRFWQGLVKKGNSRSQELPPLEKAEEINVPSLRESTPVILLFPFVYNESFPFLSREILAAP